MKSHLKTIEWGAECWNRIHVGAIHLGQISRRGQLTAASIFFESALRRAVNCPRCAFHVKPWVRRNRLHVGVDLFKWTWDLHDAVNAALKKSERPALEESRSYWKSEHAKLSRGQLAQMGLPVQ
jgi:predicted GNAT superfamily acetyltransferase